MTAELIASSEMRAFNMFVGRAYMITYTNRDLKLIKDLIDVTAKVQLHNGRLNIQNDRFPDNFDIYLELLLERTDSYSTLSQKVQL